MQTEAVQPRHRWSCDIVSEVSVVLVIVTVERCVWDDYEVDAFFEQRNSVAAKPVHIADGRDQCPVVAHEQRVLPRSYGGRGHSRCRDAISRGDRARAHDAVRVSQRAHAVRVAVHVAAVLTAVRPRPRALHAHQHQRRTPAPVPAGPTASAPEQPGATGTVSATVLAGQGQRGCGRPDA